MLLISMAQKAIILICIFPGFIRVPNFTGIGLKKLRETRNVLCSREKIKFAAK